MILNSNFDLAKALKFHLPTWKHKKFWQWCSSQRRDGYEWHHLVGRKYSDLFVVLIPADQHKRIHNSGYQDDEFEELFFQSINNIMRYIDEAI